MNLVSVDAKERSYDIKPTMSATVHSSGVLGDQKWFKFGLLVFECPLLI